MTRSPTSMTADEPVIAVLRNRKLASLGDAYINFVFSLALTKTRKEPIGHKPTDKQLAEALRISGIRSLLPKRTSSKVLADAYESIVAYAYLRNLITIEESVDVLSSNIAHPESALASLATLTLQRISH